VYYAELDPTVGHEQAGRRPVLVLSDNRFNERSGTAVVVPLTSKKPRVGFPLAFELGVEGVDRAVSYVKPGQVRTISTLRLGRFVGTAEQAVELCLDALLQICGRPPTVPLRANDG
jgi:mRNA interferase MazF